MSMKVKFSGEQSFKQQFKFRQIVNNNKPGVFDVTLYGQVYKLVFLPYQSNEPNSFNAMVFRGNGEIQHVFRHRDYLNKQENYSIDWSSDTLVFTKSDSEFVLTVKN